VRVGEVEGTVMELGMFETRLRTGLGEEVTMPNRLGAVQHQQELLARAYPGAGFVLDTTVTIGYDTPWRQVHAMLELAAQRTEDIAKSKPYVMQVALTDFYPEYRLVAYVTAEAPRQRRRCSTACTRTLSTCSTNTACKSPRRTSCRNRPLRRTSFRRRMASRAS
jgi:small-conductance mechanosensitive channel